MCSKNQFLLTNIQKINHFVYFTGIIDYSELDTEKFFSFFNSQKLKARFLAKNFDCVLTAPVKYKLKQLHVIIFEEAYKEEYLTRLANEATIKLVGPQPLQYEICLECIRFTLATKISTEWNQIKDYFFKAQNFQKLGSPTDCLDLHLLMSGDTLKFCARPLQLKLPNLNLSDLGIDSEIFWREGSAPVKLDVCVLPHLHQATATYVYSKLPSSSPFKGYNDVKVYWERLHGYILPSPEEETIYIEATFGWNNFTYIYPLICVYRDKPIEIKSKGKSDIIKDFIEELESKFSRVCDNRIQQNSIENFIFCPTLELYHRKDTNIGINENYFRTSSKQKSKMSHFKKENVSWSRSFKTVAAPSLLKFCKENGIAVKPKEGKKTLVQKVCNFLRSKLSR